MIIVKFQGGLGNQISQYAFLRLMQNKYPGIKVKADLSFYNKNNDHQGYELEKRFVSCKIESASIMEMFLTMGKMVYPYKEGKYNKILDVAIRASNRLFPLKDNQILHQSITSGYPEENKFFELDTRKNWYLEGYWHSYDYSSIMENLRKELSFQPLNDNRNRECLQLIKNRQSVSIHIRRGDYVNSGYDIIGDEYYTSAIQLLQKQIQNPIYIVFSDDIKYAQKMLDRIGCHDVRYVSWNQGENSYYDMYLMSQCKHNIIANSTFSYWAAQLNENQQKIVIRPEMQTRERKTWLVDGWIRL